MNRVAIACQGGGAHTAFSAGALQELLPWIEDHGDLVALSGSSGGAVCGIAAWYGWLEGGGKGAAETLEALWADVAASGPMERWLNDALVYGARVRNSGAPLPSFSPYVSPVEGLGKREFRRTLERHVDFAAVPDLLGPDAPRLIVGSVNVTRGVFETFEDEAVTPEAVLASSALPTVVEGIEIDGEIHWDGLFSQNPPIHELFATDSEHKPDELWVIQINPQGERDEPRSLEAIHDRRNELAGNLSLHQELRFVEQVNDWVKSGTLPADEFKEVTVRRLPLDRELEHSSKLDRDPAFLEELETAGRADARKFLRGLPFGG